MSTRTILVATDAAGAFTHERPLFGAIVAVAFLKGDLDDATDIVLSDPVDGTTIRTQSNITTDEFWQPGNPVAVYGTLRIEVSNGGDTRHGRIRLLLET